jgi:hypothetical protein
LLMAKIGHLDSEILGVVDDFVVGPTHEVKEVLDPLFLESACYEITAFYFHVCSQTLR